MAGISFEMQNVTSTVRKTNVFIFDGKQPIYVCMYLFI